MAKVTNHLNTLVIVTRLLNFFAIEKCSLRILVTYTIEYSDVLLLLPNVLRSLVTFAETSEKSSYL